MVNKWNDTLSLKHEFSWTGLTVAAVHVLCQQQATTNPEWHPDISVESLDSYFEEIPPNRLWWQDMSQAAAPANDGHTLSLCGPH